MVASGLPETCTTHWARHSLATLLRMGVDRKTIGEIVGHGSVAVTDNYIHDVSNLADETMEKFAGLLQLS